MTNHAQIARTQHLIAAAVYRELDERGLGTIDFSTYGVGRFDPDEMAARMTLTIYDSWLADANRVRLKRAIGPFEVQNPGKPNPVLQATEKFTVDTDRGFVNVTVIFELTGAFTCEVVKEVKVPKTTKVAKAIQAALAGQVLSDEERKILSENLDYQTFETVREFDCKPKVRS